MNNRLHAVAILIITMLFPGCQRDAGRGGTGELVVARAVLREVEPIVPEQFAIAQPATVPSTLPTTRPHRDAAEELPLSIYEARQIALQNNLDLRVDLFNPSIVRENINQEEARFESLFTGTIDYGKSDSPSANQITEQLEGSQSERLGVRPGVRVPLRTGGAIDVGVPISRFESDSPSALLNPAYTSDLAVTLTQPLLRGAGTYVNTQGIRVAFYAYQQAQARTKLSVIAVLTDVDRVYWRLYAAREALKVRVAEYDLAVAQLERAQALVRGGALPEVEILRAQAGVADAVEQVIIAENFVRDRQRELKRILNAPGLDIGGPTTLVIATDPRPIYYRVDPDLMIERAMIGRMDLLDLELELARDTSEIHVARNDLLPLVSLQYTYNINGLGGSMGDAFDELRDSDFVDHRLGVSVDVPIGNAAARSRLRQSMLARMQTLATVEQRELAIRQEVLNAIDQLEATWQRILAARQRVIAESRVLEAEIRQFEQGLRTSTEVLEAQTRLANARLSEISAVTEYQIAQVDIAFATGTVLGASRVLWEPALLPRTRP
ncbi:MAG TPA: TolC family protein [Tepidisphaeraceae bacterium]|nr:TolC family protein [Tepidisphaeraceae bacterium]